jgi:ATP-dependent DNA ligase
LFTRRGYDWTDRYPLIGAAADALPCDGTIDGEVVVCGPARRRAADEGDKFAKRPPDGCSLPSYRQ